MYVTELRHVAGKWIFLEEKIIPEMVGEASSFSGPI